MGNGNALEWSHGRARPTVRVDEVTAPQAADAGPQNDPTTGRFVRGNRQHRRRWLKERAKGVSTLNPARVPTWMQPFAEDGAEYAVAPLALLDGRPELHRLAGDAADAHTLFRANLALAAEAVEAKERRELAAEARGWLREHRTALATLCSLAGNIKALPETPEQMRARVFGGGK